MLDVLVYVGGVERPASHAVLNAETVEFHPAGNMANIYQVGEGPKEKRLVMTVMGAAVIQYRRDREK